MPDLQTDLPADLADVSLIDARTCAAAAGISLASWYQAVRDREAPQPVVRSHRCTRWRRKDIVEFLAEICAQGVDDELAAEVFSRTRKASAAAKKKRQAARASRVPT